MTPADAALNDYGQPIGRPLVWSGATTPGSPTLVGRYVTIEPLTPSHASELFPELGQDARIWTYLPAEAPRSVTELAATLQAQCEDPDARPFLIRDRRGRAVGTISYLRIQPEIGSIEVGWVTFGPALQRTPASTEVQFLMMRHAFDDLGYRRYEWKCDSLNAPSRAAAARLGFHDEGTWRNALVVKGRNRDTTWLSITSEEWPVVKGALEAWLAPANFDPDGNQRKRLQDFRLR